jgi:site-specific DNA recombinase
MSRTARQPAQTTKAVGYIRVSTDDQALSVSAQRQRIAAWCTERNLELLTIHEDVGISGGADLDKRPGLMAAIGALSKGIALVAVKRDRIARDAMNAAMIERLAERVGATVMTCDGAGEGNTPEARLMRTLIDAFSEYERAIIRARTIVALAHKRAKGERTSLYAPYGYLIADDGKTLDTHDGEQLLVAAIRDAREQGLSHRAVVSDLAQNGFHTRKGTAIGLRQVQRIMEQAQIA